MLKTRMLEYYKFGLLIYEKCMRIYFSGFVEFFFSFHNDKKNTNAGILPRKMKSASEKQLNYLNLHIDHREEDLRGQTK